MFEYEPMICPHCGGTAYIEYCATYGDCNGAYCECGWDDHCKCEKCTK
jgi:hypothetical protein